MIAELCKQLTADQLAAVYAAFIYARDWDNARIAKEAGYANCGVDEFDELVNDVMVKSEAQS